MMMAVALPSEHHRLASGHAGSRWASMEVPRVEVSKIWLGSPLTVFPKDKYAQWKDGIAWTQRRGAPLLAAPLPKSHVEQRSLPRPGHEAREEGGLTENASPSHTQRGLIGRWSARFATSFLVRKKPAPPGGEPSSITHAVIFLWERS